MPSSGFATPGWRQHALAGAVWFAGCALPGAARASNDVASAPHTSERAVAPRAHFAAPSSFTPPIHELNERFRPTSLPAGRWALSTSFGASLVDPLNADSLHVERYEGVYFHGDFLLPSLSWGITDRLQINLTRPGAAYRFGEDGQTEWLVALQMPFLMVRDGGVGLALLATADMRTWISSARPGLPKTTALAASWSAQTRFVDEADSNLPSSSFEVFLVQAQVGTVHFIDSWWTLAPNVGVAVVFDTREAGVDTAVTFLSEISRGVWSDPFLRLHFARWGSFDVYPSLGYEIGTTTLVAGGAGGFSFAW